MKYHDRKIYRWFISQTESSFLVVLTKGEFLLPPDELRLKKRDFIKAKGLLETYFTEVKDTPVLQNPKQDIQLYLHLKSLIEEAMEIPHPCDVHPEASFQTKNTAAFFTLLESLMNNHADYSGISEQDLLELYASGNTVNELHETALRHFSLHQYINRDLPGESIMLLVLSVFIQWMRSFLIERKWDVNFCDCPPPLPKSPLESIFQHIQDGLSVLQSAFPTEDSSQIDLCDVFQDKIVLEDTEFSRLDMSSYFECLTLLSQIQSRIDEILPTKTPPDLRNSRNPPPEEWKFLFRGRKHLRKYLDKEIAGKDIRQKDSLRTRRIRNIQRINLHLSAALPEKGSFMAFFPWEEKKSLEGELLSLLGELGLFLSQEIDAVLRYKNGWYNPPQSMCLPIPPEKSH